MPNQSEMTTITTLTKEQIDLLLTYAMVVRDDNGVRYYHLPLWYKDLGKGEFEVFENFEKLPQDMQDYVNAIQSLSEVTKKLVESNKILITGFDHEIIVP